MRKLLFAAALSLISAGLFAQDIESIRNMWLVGQLKKSKDDIDKAMANAKFNAKPEAWLLKSSIYASLSADKDMAAQSADLLKESIISFDTYKQKEPDYKILKAENSYYSGTPGILYSSYFNSGLEAFNKKEWAKAFTQFEAAVAMSDFLIATKMITAAVDTSGTLLAGASAQNSEQMDKAVHYYTKLANIKLGGSDNEFMYPFLVEYYLKKGDTQNKEKYIAIGRELYPNNNYWCNVPLIEAGEDTLKIFAAYEKMIVDKCGNFETYYDYARELYNYTYFSKTKPVEAPKYEARMNEMVAKSLELKETAEANFLKCRILFIHVNDLVDKYNAVKGTKPEDVKKRNEITAQLDAKYEELLPYANKTYDFYDTNPKLKGGEKVNFKVVTNMLIEYWTNKKDKEKIKKYEDRQAAIQ
jgi:hypothetical protein